MATKEGKQWWDPYETSNRRQFIYRPNSAAEILLYPTSTSSFIDSYSQSGPFGSTVYKKDFSWKPACKPECIRTGTASGQRRNNPHPSQSFLMWRQPRDGTRSCEYVGRPWKCPLSEEQIRKALTAQYCSTYRCDFMGRPQGHDCVNNAERRLAPLHSRPDLQLSADTDMRDKPKPKPEPAGGRSHCSGGIVPTVVQRHAQQERCDLTNYDRFCGRVADVTRVLKSLLPQELQQLHSVLPEEGREAVRKALRKDAYPDSRRRANKLPAVELRSCSPERISTWPGPF